MTDLEEERVFIEPESVYNIYYATGILLLIPVASFLIFLSFGEALGNLTSIFGFVGIIGMLPFSLLSAVISTVGFIKAGKNGNRINTRVGVVSIILSGLFVLLGGFLLVYVFILGALLA